MFLLQCAEQLSLVLSSQQLQLQQWLGLSAAWAVNVAYVMTDAMKHSMCCSDELSHCRWRGCKVVAQQWQAHP